MNESMVAREITVDRRRLSTTNIGGSRVADLYSGGHHHPSRRASTMNMEQRHDPYEGALQLMENFTSKQQQQQGHKNPNPAGFLKKLIRIGSMGSMNSRDKDKRNNNKTWESPSDKKNKTWNLGAQFHKNKGTTKDPLALTNKKSSSNKKKPPLPPSFVYVKGSSSRNLKDPLHQLSQSQQQLEHTQHTATGATAMLGDSFNTLGVQSRRHSHQQQQQLVVVETSEQNYKQDMHDDVHYVLYGADGEDDEESFVSSVSGSSVSIQEQLMHQRVFQPAKSKTPSDAVRNPHNKNYEYSLPPLSPSKNNKRCQYQPPTTLEQGHRRASFTTVGNSKRLEAVAIQNRSLRNVQEWQPPTNNNNNNGVKNHSYLDREHASPHAIDALVPKITPGRCQDPIMTAPDSAISRQPKSWPRNSTDTSTYASSPTVLLQQQHKQPPRIANATKDRQRHLQEMNERGCDWFPLEGQQQQQQDSSRNAKADRPAVVSTHQVSSMVSRFENATSATTPTQSNDANTKKSELVQIYPGMYVPLRSAQETKVAIANDFYRSIPCWSCSTSMFCILDAAYVICPTCRVISPLEDGSDGRVMVRRGLGMGFTGKTLCEMKRDNNNNK
ncbi:expressed unknown protein [Seminavis robusta]|uniref:Uncharacterized protein n=1 Tax=Seminavis robusta TaxID=568900 RepID=A0A9N8D9I8_9STRA|nr:expressed unknown protein [Seminavis robusta]|eukprot:Sro5_g004050.1 n/a (611) ;mRNA; f:37653-39596